MQNKYLHGNLVLCSISNEPLRVGEGNITRRGPVPLVIGNNLHFAILEHTNTGIGRPQINPDRFHFAHLESEM